MPVPSPISDANSMRPLSLMMNADVCRNCTCTQPQMMFSPPAVAPINNFKQLGLCNCEKCQNNNANCSGGMCGRNGNSQYGCIMHSQPTNNGFKYENNKFVTLTANQTNLANPTSAIPNRFKFNKIKR